MDNLISTFKPFTPSELLATFPEALPAIRRNIKELKEKKALIEEVGGEALESCLIGLYSDDTISPMWRDNFWVPAAHGLFLNWPLENVVPQLTFLERLMRIHKGYQDDTAEFEMRIAKAKELNLAEVTGHDKPKVFIRCIFHNEDTPSCKLEGNRFHCFGCGADGDAVDFIMKRDGVPFNQALAMLIP